MIVEAEHPDTGEKIKVDIPNLTEDKLRDLLNEHATDEQVNQYIDRLPVGAEVKAIIAKLAKMTIKIGKATIKLGKRLLEIAIYLVNSYKKVTFYMILAALLVLVISMIPFLGPILGAYLAPFILTLGLAKGVYEELKASEPELVKDMGEQAKVFNALTA